MKLVFILCMQLYFVRHTRVDVPSGICYGMQDVPLANTFHQEWEEVKSRLSGIDFECTFSSPLLRCLLPAKKICEEVIIDERLQEMNFGDWEGKCWDEIFASQEGKRWFGDYLHATCPNGESNDRLTERVQAFINDLPQTSGNILIITHAGVIRAFLVLLCGWMPKKAFDTPIAYGQVIQIEITANKNR